MNQAQALRARQQVLKGLSLALSRILLPVVGKSISQAALKTLAGATRPYVRRARDALSVSATRQYQSLVGSRPLSRPALTHFGEDAWHASLEKALPIADETPLVVAHVEAAQRKAEFWARDAERGALIDYAQRDPRIARWARIDPEPPTCGFCTVLISRGAVYLTKESAVFAEQAKFNTGCTCVATLVLKGKETSFDGYAQQQAAQAEYIAARKVAASHDLSGIVQAIESLRGGSTP